MIDGGSTNNIVSQALVDHLKLKIHKHHCSHFVRWLNTSDEVHVWHTCQVTFAISQDYISTIWCDVIPKNCGDVLLGRPWMYNKNGIHEMWDNKYTFVHDGKSITLHPMKSEPLKKGSMTNAAKESFKICHIYTIIKFKVELFCNRGEWCNTQPQMQAWPTMGPKVV